MPVLSLDVPGFTRQLVCNNCIEEFSPYKFWGYVYFCSQTIDYDISIKQSKIDLKKTHY